MTERFTAGRVPEAGIAELFATPARWQAWLDVEAALARAQAELGIIPEPAAKAISEVCTLDRLDLARIQDGIARTSHPLMPLITELATAAGEPHGRWVHWGVTTQNITQTGDVLVIRRAHEKLLGMLSELLRSLADLTERGADMVMAGRTHGQHAVPITFGLKTASWLDELGRHIVRLRQLAPRLFVAIIGGAVGNFASLGARGPGLQSAVADRLGLASMLVPARNISDHFAEFTGVLGLLAGTCGRIGREIYTLMKTEYGEVEEPVPPGTVGSSTMPQKRNPQLCQDIIGITAEIRALVPLALEAMGNEHEADHAPSMMFDVVRRSCVLTGDALTRISVVTGGLTLHPDRMRANLGLTGGAISAEAIMLELGSTIGRQTAHEIVYEAAQTAAATGQRFVDLVKADSRITDHLSPAALTAILDPSEHTGLSAAIAHGSAADARTVAVELESVGSGDSDCHG
ncbi:adenylosuccinate lyase family protein [Amycolatopsis sp. EV170708-02-1]|uniref:class-II fumarase/aspartase family protein n=1 Tax=Amycolatopsis sp. EV170708-02-1 TaxID=2919322 RepID=UPI001F0C23AF|nr:adenylosuccinate lyase family protein [Amycolatopsis sp. EV170708-02-1]UMP00115.1 adenylosuccinate lyase family protein [Amycolatopsis sp. EV170708-02-1]